MSKTVQNNLAESSEHLSGGDCKDGESFNMKTRDNLSASRASINEGSIAEGSVAEGSVTEPVGDKVISKSLKPPIDDRIVENLLVENPENVDFKAKRNAFLVMAEKRKTNDTYQKFKGTKPEVGTKLSPKPEWKYQTFCVAKETKSQATETERELSTDTEIQTDSEFERIIPPQKSSIRKEEVRLEDERWQPESKQHNTHFTCIMLWVLSMLIAIYIGTFIQQYNEQISEPEL